MSNRVLAGYEPASVWHFFEDISAIPRVSGDEKAVADYVENFGRERGLPVYRDEVNNVFIKCPATEGHETATPVLLQGHMDMVGEKDPDSDHDFSCDGLTLGVTEDGWIHADRTTLGGDDGIAVAMMLSILDNPPTPHPAIECLFTVSEETGLCGAWAFDPDRFEAHAGIMINLDSEAEGILTAGCAGGVRTDITVPVTTSPASGTAVRLTLSGFSGGHSGVEIQEGHMNAIKVLGRMLSAVVDRGLPVSVATVSGGGKDNAIPREAHAVLTVPDDRAAELTETLQKEAELIRDEPNVIASDRDFTCRIETLPERPSSVMDNLTMKRVLSLLTLARDGVISMSAHVDGLVACSRNLGILSTTCRPCGCPEAVVASFSARSACAHHLDEAQRELETLGSLIGASVGHYARYPGWDYAVSSPLRDLWTRVSERLFQVTPRVEVIHAGLECGILCDKMPQLDIISVGPDMKDIHTSREQLSIPSSERTFRLLCEVVKELS